MKCVDRWDEFDGSRYMTIMLNDKENVDVKLLSNGFSYVLGCANGKEVYENDAFGIRNLTREEASDVLEFATEQINVEAELDERQVIL